MRRLAAVPMLIAWLVAGCSMFADAPAEPQPCGNVYSPQRCLTMTDVAAAEVGRTRDDVKGIVIVPEPPPPDGMLVTRGGATPIRVRLTFIDASSHDAAMCGGIASGPACVDDPHLEAIDTYVPGVGYRDLPCTGDTEDTCATPLPTFDPAAVAAARPLMIERLDIPIDRRGPFAVRLGEVGLPNGVITSASFAFEDDWPKGMSISDASGRIEVRSLEPDGKPFEGYYQHGWRPGVERVEAVLTFDVLWFENGAVLGIRDVVVR